MIDCYSVPCAAMTTIPALPPEMAPERLTPPTRWADPRSELVVTLQPFGSVDAAVSCTWYPELDAELRHGCLDAPLP